MHQLVAFLRQCRQIVREPETAQFLRHLPDAVDAVQHLLTNVATLAVTHRAAFQTGLQRQVGFVHVRTVTRNARLDARHFKRGPAARAAAHRFGGGDQFVRHQAKRVDWHEEVEPLQPGSASVPLACFITLIRGTRRRDAGAPSQPRVVHQINFSEPGVRDFDNPQRLAGSF